MQLKLVHEKTRKTSSVLSGIKTFDKDVVLDIIEELLP